MKIYKYENYDEYKKSQVDANKRKLDRSWVSENSVRKLSNYIYNHNKPSFGICHGTRQGLEQKYFISAFKKLGINVDVLGTEISPTANQFPNTIEWDFHNTKPEWIGNVDFIYSNSFDHSYKPVECLKEWMRCLSHKGLCILEWSSVYEGRHSGHKTDPFSASLEEYRAMISNDYLLKDEIPFKRGGGPKKSRFLIIENVVK